MSQDYAKRAARHRQQLSKKPAIPLWRILLTLLAIAGFSGFLYFLTQRGLSTQQVSPPPAAAAKTGKTPAPPLEEAPDDLYDFYQLLPQAEVVAPVAEEPLSTDKPEITTKRYLLQAGSFRNHHDADRLRAMLILEGLTVKISSVNDQRGRQWHRVLVGPFQSRSKLNHAQDILAGANTESMLIELK